MSNIVKCRICHQQIDKKILKENIDWVMPSKKYYYHKNCYEDWAKKKDNVAATASDKEYFDMLYDYLVKDLKIPIDFIKIKGQWDSFIRKGMTAKGIFFCTKFFYEIKKGDEKKSKGGIGIIPYVYSEGTQYWSRRIQEDEYICEKIEEQIRQRRAREKKIIKKAKKDKDKIQKNFEETLKLIDEISEMEDN